VIAESVETHERLAALLQINCRFAQGLPVLASGGQLGRAALIDGASLGRVEVCEAAGSCTRDRSAE
jgi:hypothetical protein